MTKTSIFRKVAVAATTALAAFTISACGAQDTRSDADWAADLCEGHGAIRSFSPDGYYQAASVVCNDGTAAAR